MRSADLWSRWKFIRRRGRRTFSATYITNLIKTKGIISSQINQKSQQESQPPTLLPVPERLRRAKWAPEQEQPHVRRWSEPAADVRAVHDKHAVNETDARANAEADDESDELRKHSAHELARVVIQPRPTIHQSDAEPVETTAAVAKSSEKDENGENWTKWAESAEEDVGAGEEAECTTELGIYGKGK